MPMSSSNEGTEHRNYLDAISRSTPSSESRNNIANAAKRPPSEEAHNCRRRPLSTRTGQSSETGAAPPISVEEVLGDDNLAISTASPSPSSAAAENRSAATSASSLLLQSPIIIVGASVSTPQPTRADTISATTAATTATSTAIPNETTLSHQLPSPQYFLLYFCYRLTCLLIQAAMNAAITIFGFGVGVGLILGDSIRTTGENNGTATDHSHPSTAAAAAASIRHLSQQALPGGGRGVGARRPSHAQHPPPQPHPQSSTVLLLRPATPSCRALIQRDHSIQDDDPPNANQSQAANNANGNSSSTSLHARWSAIEMPAQ